MENAHRRSVGKKGAPIVDVPLAQRGKVQESFKLKRLGGKDGNFTS